MNIGNIELTKEKLIIAISAVIVFIVLVIFYAPLIRELRMRYLECRLCEGQLIGAHKIIESLGTHRGAALMSETNVSGAVDKLIKHCSSIGINVLSITPKEIIIEEGSLFKILPIDMETRSTIQQFAAFIGSLSELKQGLIKVKSFDLAPDTEDKAKLRASLALDMFLANVE